MFKIKGSAKDGNPESSVPPDDEMVDSAILLDNNENNINAFQDPSITIQGPITRIEDLINVDAFDFPVLGTLGMSASKWVVQLKVKLREMGANGYSIYEWPEDLMNMFLAYPLSDIMEFDIQAAKYSETKKSYARSKEWKRVDVDGIFPDTDVTSVYIDTREPYEFLIEKFKTIFAAHPPFRNFFSAGMSGTRIQKQLFDIYVGMWTAREFVSMVVRASIPSDYWNDFAGVKILSAFFKRYSTLLTKFEWKDIGNLFENFNKYLHYDQTVQSVDSILSTAVDMKDVARHVGILDSLTPQHIQHYLYLQLISLFKAKISKSCDVSDDIFNLEELETLKPANLLTQESAKKVIASMLNHAQKYLPRQTESIGRLERLPNDQVTELRRKILEGTLSDEDQATVKTYEFLFTYSIEKRKNLEQEAEAQKAKKAKKQRKAERKQQKKMLAQQNQSPSLSLERGHSNTPPANAGSATQSTMLAEASTQPTITTSHTQPAMSTILPTRPAMNTITTNSVMNTPPMQPAMNNPPPTQPAMTIPFTQPATTHPAQSTINIAPSTQSAINTPTAQLVVSTIPTTQYGMDTIPITQSVTSTIPTTQPSHLPAPPRLPTSDPLSQPFASSITSVLPKESVATAVPISRSPSVSSTTFQSPFSHQSSLEPRETQNSEDLAGHKRKFNELENATKPTISPTPPPPQEPITTARVVRPTRRVLNPDF